MYLSGLNYVSGSTSILISQIDGLTVSYFPLVDRNGNSIYNAFLQSTSRTQTTFNINWGIYESSHKTSIECRYIAYC